MTIPAPELRHIRLLQGESLAGRVFYLGNNGRPYDLYGGSARMAIRKSPGDVSAILTLESPDGIIYDPILASLEPIADHATIAAIAPIVARYDLFFNDSRGRSFTIAFGTFSVSAANTRNT